MNKKKILSLLLVCCILVGMLPAALAEEPIETDSPVETSVPQEEIPQESGTPQETETPAPANSPEPTIGAPSNAPTADSNTITADTKSITTAGTYELTGDVTLNATLNIAAPENQEVIINLNGHTLTGPTASNGESYAITMDDEASGGHKGTLTLNGGGGTVTGQGGIAAYSGTAVLNNVTVTGTGSNRYPLGAFYGSNVTVGADCTITGTNNCAIFIVSKVADKNPAAPRLTVYGKVSTTSTNSSAIQGNGKDMSHTIIKIGQGAEITATDIGIFLPQDGDVTIDGATIKGKSGIGIKSGTLTIKDSTISGTGDYVDTAPNNNGMAADGSALLIESNPAYTGGMAIKISGNSKLTSTNGHAVREIQATDGKGFTSLEITGGTFTSATGKDAITMLENDAKNVTITGGTFSTDPKEFVGEGYAVEESGGSFKVVGKPVIEDTTVTLPETSVDKDGKAEVTVTDSKSITDIISGVDSGTAEEPAVVTIDASNTTGGNEAKSSEVTLPKAIMNAAKEKDNVELAIKTPVGEIQLDKEASTKLAAESGNVTLTIAKTEKTGEAPKFEVKFTENNTEKELEDVSITLTFDVGKNLNNPFLICVDSNKVGALSNQEYDKENGTITGTTTHLSTFSFSDLKVEAATAGGLGKISEVTSTYSNLPSDHKIYMTVEATTNGKNTFLTIPVDSGTAVPVSYADGATLTIWITYGQPDVTNGTPAKTNILATYPTRT